MANVETRQLEKHEIVSAIAQWCRSNGYAVYSVGTRQISETEIVVGARVRLDPGK